MGDYIKEHYDFPLTKLSENKPLKGVRVIDAGNMVAAPFATVLLADFGADVIKIEHPKYGDGQRKLEPIMDGIPLWWKSVSRNKRCITLDLGKAQGAEIFKQLIKGKDVIVENYRPGTFEKWGIGPDVICDIDPRIILLRISGFGQTGVEVAATAFDEIRQLGRDDRVHAAHVGSHRVQLAERPQDVVTVATLGIHRVPDDDLAGALPVLVRPDGHVCWRGDVLDIDPAALVDRVRGA